MSRSRTHRSPATSGPNSLSSAVTSQPAAQNACAVAKPMPRPAPVTRLSWPSHGATAYAVQQNDGQSGWASDSPAASVGRPSAGALPVCRVRSFSGFGGTSTMLKGLRCAITPARTFTFQGGRFAACGTAITPPGTTRRAVERSIVQRFLEDYRGRRVLEDRRPLNRYAPFPRRAGQMRAWRRHHQPRTSSPSGRRGPTTTSSACRRWNTWGGTSTEEPDKVLRGVENLRTHCLAPGGVMLLTMPIGSNRALDQCASDRPAELHEGILAEAHRARRSVGGGLEDRSAGHRVRHAMPRAATRF